MEQVSRRIGVNFSSFLDVFNGFCDAQSLLFVPFLDYFYDKGLIGNDCRFALYTDVHPKPL